MKHEQKILVVASLGLMSAISGTALAANAPSTAPTLGSVLEASGITASGYVAASYYHSTGVNTFHNYDYTHDTFALDQASLTLAYQPKEGFGALVNVIGGEDAWLMQNSSSNAKLAVAQGYVQYAGGPVTVIAGKYYTLAGAEVTAVTGNANFSRSLLYTFEPAYHTGVRATIAASDTLSFMVGVNNGWNLDRSGFAPSAYGSKTGEVGFSFAPVKAFSLAAAGYFGKDPVYDAQKTLIDLVATFNVTDSLSFLLSYDHGTQDNANAFGASTKKNAKWDGVAAYANFAINDQWRLSVRAEELNDKNGFLSSTYLGVSSPVVQKLKEGTVTVGYAPVKSFELRGEVRYDKSNQSTFVQTDHVSTKDNQTEFALQGVYKFGTT